MDGTAVFPDAVVREVPHELGSIFQGDGRIGLQIRGGLVTEAIWADPGPKLRERGLAQGHD